MTRRCGWITLGGRMGDTYDHSLTGVHGRRADRTLMVEPDSAEPIWRDIAVSVGAITNVGKPFETRSRRRARNRPLHSDCPRNDDSARSAVRFSIH